MKNKPSELQQGIARLKELARRITHPRQTIVVHKEEVDEWEKDIARLETFVKRIEESIVFLVDKEQQAKLAEWNKTQPFVAQGAIGGQFTYSFTGTTLGEVVKVKNGANGQEVDLTDYKSW